MIINITVELYDKSGDKIISKEISKDSFIPRVGDNYSIALEKMLNGFYVHLGTVTEVMVQYYEASKNECITIKVKE